MREVEYARLGATCLLTSTNSEVQCASSNYGNRDSGKERDGVGET